MRCRHGRRVGHAGPLEEGVVCSRPYGGRQGTDRALRGCGQIPDAGHDRQADNARDFNPGGTNERFARANFKQAQLVLHPDNVTIFQQIVDGKADVMVTDSSEVLWQAKLHPELCPINPDKPLQFAEKAFMLPRADVAFKEFVDAWMHMLKATGDYDRIVNKWLH